MPMTTRTVPLIIYITLEYRLKRFKRGDTASKAAPIIRKGIPNPREYIASSRAPCEAVSEVTARVRMPPSIGPTHGLSTRVNRIPVMKERM